MKLYTIYKIQHQQKVYISMRSSTIIRITNILTRIITHQFTLHQIYPTSILSNFKPNWTMIVIITIHIITTNVTIVITTIITIIIHIHIIWIAMDI